MKYIVDLYVGGKVFKEEVQAINPKDAREKFKELCGARDGIASFVEKSYIQTKNILNKN